MRHIFTEDSRPYSQPVMSDPSAYLNERPAWAYFLEEPFMGWNKVFPNKEP
jgi:hypothetical protein